MRPHGRPTALVAATGVLALLGACGSPMGRLDRDIDRLIAARSAALPGPAPRSIAAVGSPAERTQEQGEEQPPTVNPSEADLKYSPAVENEVVAEKLEAYAARYSEQFGPDARTITFQEALRVAQRTGREFRTAEETYTLAAIRLMIERHLWSPRLFNDTSIGLVGAGDGGRFDHAASIINTLRVTQRLPFGGDVEARWVARATDELRETATAGYTSSSELVLSGDIPLLRGFGRVAREDLIQAERDLVYAARDFERFRRELFVDIASNYFALLTTRSQIVNQLRDLDAQHRRNEETVAKVDAGKLDPYQKDITANSVRQSQASLANQRERYILQLERFKVRLGLDPSDPIALEELEFTLAPPAVTPDEAAGLALEYRLDLQNQRDGLLDSERSVQIARNNILPDLDFSASVGINTDDDKNNAGFAIDPDEADYALGLDLSMPLDRNNERLGLRQALISRDRARRNYDESRDNVVIDARQAVRQIDLARFQLELAEEQILINERGLEALELRDDSDPQSILDRQDALLDAKNSRDQAQTDLRNAILDYLLATGQIRVDESGLLSRLPGMDPAPPEVDRGDDGDVGDADAPTP